MKAFNLFLLMFLMSGKLISQNAINTEWFTPVVGGKNGYFIKHYFFSSELNKMMETMTGKGDQFDSIPLEIEVAEVLVEGGVERIFPIYSGNFSVITFRNITEDQAEVALCYEVFATLEEAKNYVAPADSYHLWHTKKGFEKEFAKPAIPPLSREDVVDFFTYCKQLLDKAKAESPDLDKKKLQSVYTQLLIGAALSYAQEKGYNSYKSMEVIQNGIKANAEDEEIKKIVQTFKVQ